MYQVSRGIAIRGVNVMITFSSSWQAVAGPRNGRETLAERVTDTAGHGPTVRDPSPVVGIGVYKQSRAAKCVRSSLQHCCCYVI